MRALTDGSGAVVERYRYSAYGSVTILDAGDQEIPESAVGNAYMFQGRRLDPETGLYYYRNRMMSAELGRFLQRDPLGYVDGWNLYEFVDSVPVVYTDPKGLFITARRFHIIEKRNEETLAILSKWQFKSVEFGTVAGELPSVPGLGGISTGQMYREAYCVYERDIIIKYDKYKCVGIWHLRICCSYLNTYLERRTEVRRDFVGFYGVGDAEEVKRTECN